MEVKTVKYGINDSKLKIYIDNIHWKTVKTLYFEKRLPSLIKSAEFKKKFEQFEKKKILDISLRLLSKRSYLEREWRGKMKDKLFSSNLVSEVFEESLKPYFNEDEEVKRRIGSYLFRGKGKVWIRQKMKPDLSMGQPQFEELLQELCGDEAEVEVIKQMEQTRHLIEKKGREKAIAFFLRRGFSYSTIQKALFGA